MKQLPYEIVEQMIQCFGKCFHYKDPVAAFMRSSDVPVKLINKYKDNPKFVWSRRVLEELSYTEEGLIIQRKVLTNLCNLKDLPDKQVTDRNSGIDALKKLKKIAFENDLFVKKQKDTINIQRKLAEEKKVIVKKRAEKLEELRREYNNNLNALNRQKAGFNLEELIKKLFELNDIQYKKSYRNSENTQQIDDFFKFDGFDYLVETKWISGFPSVSEIASFNHKIESKLESTRGLFVSVNGFRNEVIKEFSGKRSKIIFMDGQDLALILEGRINLKDAMNLKIEKAVQYGETFLPLYSV